MRMKDVTWSKIPFLALLRLGSKMASDMSTERDTSFNSPAGESKETQTLSQLFDNAFRMFNNINKSSLAEPINSPKVQSEIRKTMRMLEDATRLVSIVDMFSSNESFEEVATENMKYFLLPALLGTLTTKICGTDDRLHLVNVAEIYFIDFLKRMKVYGLTDLNIPDTKDDEDTTISDKVLTNAEKITQMVMKRNTVLHRYKEQKELQSHLETLEKNLSNPNIDDEIKREYFVTLLKLHINMAIEELNSLATEKPILEHMKQAGRTQTVPAQKMQKGGLPPPKLQPIIITRDQVQKKVYGAGYPSLPVMTVEEFYEKRVKEGDWPDPSQRNERNSKCQQDMTSEDNSTNRDDPEAMAKEQKIEADDPETLNQLRAMDEYKDTHRRGWGNRANRS